MTILTKVKAAPSTSEEDRILRVWTPIILRSVLMMASLVLVLGLALTATNSPGYYVRRFHLVQSGAALRAKENWSQLGLNAMRGDPHAIMTIGLVTLTLVPLVRVVFTFILFLRERDRVFIAATAYVLTGLIVGMLLGRVG